MRLSLALLLVCLVVPPGRAEEEVPSKGLVPALEAFFAEADDERRAALGVALATNHADTKAVAEAAATVRRWRATGEPDTVTTWKRSTADGVAHTIYASIPPGYDPAKAWPVLIWLHGAVSRPTDGAGASAMRVLGETADEEGFILLAPSTQRGAEWWTPNGVALIRGALRDLARGWHVDADRVAVTGFSDGASGCFHLLAHDPEPYCCFMPLMAHPGVTRLSGGPCFAANVRSRPVRAFSGAKDTLYPSVRIKPMIEELKAAGCLIEWTDLPEGGHRINSVLPEHWATLRSFWRGHPRVPLATRVQWETAVPRSEGRFGWIEILSVDSAAPSAKGAQEARLPDPTGRPKLGVRLDRAFKGSGLRLEHVEAASAAGEAGFKAGDVLLSVDGRTLDGEKAMGVLVNALATMTNRDGVFKVRRGAQTLTLQTRPRVAKAADDQRPKALGYGLPSGRLDATLGKDNRIDVTTRHVRRFKLHLADGMLDLAKPVKVYVNGVLTFNGKATGDTGYVLQQAARQIGGPAYRAFIVITL